MISSAYIHIPFCNNICSYCDFSKIYYDKNIVNKYLKELKNDIQDSYNNEELKTIYIGGGTPSALNIDELKELFKIIKVFKKSKSYEYTIECNFDSITKEKIDLFKKEGINRISFGLESINKKNLSILERNISKDKVIEIINYCKSVGLNNINVDLIYAIPNETLNILKKDIDFILSLDIPHISTYSLILENNTKLMINKTKPIREELDNEMYKLIIDKLKDYNHYEISNFSKKGYESKHNLVYWHNEEYYGFGLSASGYIENVRYAKTKSITKYLDSNYINSKSIEYLSTKDKIEYQVILNLRLKEGINLIEFKNKYNNDLSKYYNYQSLIDKGLLTLKDNHLYIKEELWYISNRIIVELLMEVIE